MNRVDALIVGAGPAGSTAAILLARAGWRVLVVEKARFPRRKVCGEYISGAAWPLLAELGVAAAFAQKAGPEVTRVGLYADDLVLEAPMPWRDGDAPPGRALGREHLDTLLLDRARAAGAEVAQPASVQSMTRRSDAWACTVEGNDGSREVVARFVIDAHGGWYGAAHADDLLGFKAHFRRASLPPGLMPLVLFPGGYGGAVHTDDGRVSFSCCIRRRALADARRRFAGMRAGEAVLHHAIDSVRGVREVLAAAQIDGPWLAAGPIRPGIKSFARNGVFAIGNAAGEAHPLIAEGISMAIQSAFLLCGALREPGDAHDAVARRYARAWRRQFAPRVHAAAAFARLATDARTRPTAIAALRAMPSMLTLGARWSGKASAFRGMPDPA